MKILKWIIIVLLVIAGVYLIFSATQPSQLQVEESIVINAPAEMVFAEIIDFKGWDNWSAWNQMDPNMKKEFSGEMGTVGAKSSWDSENNMVGKGSHEVIEVTKNEHFKTKMHFGESMDDNFATFKLEEAEGKTTVIWTMEGAKTPFYANAMNTIMKPMVSESYVKSLNNLKELVESKPIPVENPMSLEVKEVESMNILAIKDSTDGASLSDKLRELYTEISIFMASEGLEQAGMPLAIYYAYSPDKVVLEAAIPYKGEITTDDGRVVAKGSPGGSVLMGVHYGDYDSSVSMHEAIEKYGTANNYEFKSFCWEVYANDPTMVDSAAIETHIFYPMN